MVIENLTVKYRNARVLQPSTRTCSNGGRYSIAGQERYG